MSLGRLSRLVCWAKGGVSAASGLRGFGQRLPAVRPIGGGVRLLSHVPVDDLINGLTDEQIKVCS